MTAYDVFYNQLFQIGVNPEMIGVKMTNRPDVIKAALSVGKQEVDKEKHDRIKVQFDTSVFEIEIWNAAIEAAMLKCIYAVDIEQIRKLKK